MPGGPFFAQTSFNLARDIQQQQRALDIQLEDISRATRMQREAQVGREKSALQLSGQILEQQRLLVESQKRMLDAQQQLLDAQLEQGAEALADRHIQHAVLLVAVLGITATVVAAVGAATSSVLWSLFAGLGVTVALSLLTLIVMSERGKPKKPAA